MYNTILYFPGCDNGAILLAFCPVFCGLITDELACGHKVIKFEEIIESIHILARSNVRYNNRFFYLKKKLKKIKKSRSTPVQEPANPVSV